jgi:hypothetical protein
VSRPRRADGPNDLVGELVFDLLELCSLGFACGIKVECELIPLRSVVEPVLVSVEISQESVRVDVVGVDPDDIEAARLGSGPIGSQPQQVRFGQEGFRLTRRSRLLLTCPVNR